MIKPKRKAVQVGTLRLDDKKRKATTGTVPSRTKAGNWKINKTQECHAWPPKIMQELIIWLFLISF
jgi:hypothetical protein